jgi:hypothetical protein
MDVAEYRKKVLAHARKRGYGEPVRDGESTWVFSAPSGATVRVDYEVASPEDLSWRSWETRFRSAKFYLTKEQNLALGIKPEPRTYRPTPKSNNPTERLDTDWLDAFGPDFDKYPEELEAGKWLMYVRESNVDEVWTKIKAAVEAGQLAYYAKISTAVSKPWEAPYVLCVYVPDCRDREAAMVLRERLRELGFKSKISFKTDGMTEAGISGSLFTA